MNTKSLAMLIYASSTWVRRLVLAGLILAMIPTAWLSIQLTPPGEFIATWWPVEAIAVIAAICSRGHRVLVSLATVAALTATHLFVGLPLGLAVGIGVANAAEAWIIATVATWGQDSTNFQRVTDAGRFIFATLAGAFFVGVLAAIIALAVSNSNPLLAAASVAPSHASAVLLLAPLALLPAYSFTTTHRLELTLQVVVLAVTIYLVFTPAQNFPFTFLPFPVLGWAAVRFATGVTALESLGIGVVTLWLTANGGGPFAATDAWDTSAGLHMLQLFLVVIAGTMLVLGRVRSEREKLVALVDAREKVLRTGITGSSLAFVILEQKSLDEARVVVANDAALELLPSDGSSWRVGDMVAPESFPELLVAPMRSIMHGKETSWVGEIQDASNVREVEVRLTRLFDPTGGYVLTIQAEDVTAYNFAREADARSLANERATVHQLKEANRQKDDFVSAVSHELRTPVTSIIGFTEELSELDLPDPAPEYVAIVARNANRLGELVEDLLNVARMASAKGSGEFEGVDMAALVSEVVDDLHHSWETRGISVSIDSRGQMTLWTVRAAVLRILTNLISNAVKFSPEGGRIEVQLAADETTFSIRITDQGPGVPADQLDVVFERFYRAPSASTVAGTGLGLPIVRTLSEQLGGTVHLESDGQSGTTAVLALPVQVASPAQEPSASS